MLPTISKELRSHAPFTALGALGGVVVMIAMVYSQVPRSWSASLFGIFHPLHVLLSAVATTGMYRLHSRRAPWPATLLVGYFGSIGIATLSDCLIPYLAEWMLDLPNRGAHLGFIEEWWLVNPLALLGIALAWHWPRTKFPHTGHVLLSTSASLFHVTMVLGGALNVGAVLLISVFLFIAVWVPCCASDIVFPLLFAKGRTSPATH